MGCKGPRRFSPQNPRDGGRGARRLRETPLVGSRLPLTGLVLAGGRSRRMGHDKAALPWPPGHSTTLLQYTVDQLWLVCREVIVVGRSKTEVPGVRTVVDALPGRGSLGGLYSGLMAASTEYCLAVACDLPFLNPSLLRFMASLAGDEDALVPLAGGRAQPLHAIYRKSCLPPLRACLARNELRMGAFLKEVNVRFLEEDDCRKHDPELLSFWNLNSPEDLVEAQRMWQRLGGRGPKGGGPS